MKVDGSLKSLLQGVSQQPARDRLPGQGTLQENMSSDPVSGLTRRPPTDMVGKLGTSTAVRGWYNFEARDGRKFLAWFHDNVVDVFDLNATKQVVTYEAGTQEYLALAGNFRCSTDEDENVTYVVNTAAKPVMKDDVPAYISESSAIVQVLGGQYGRAYTVTLNGNKVVEFMTPDGSNAGHSVYIATQYIAQAIEWCLTHTFADGNTGKPAPVLGNNDFYKVATGAMANTAVWEIIRADDVLYIRNKNGTKFNIAVNDDYGNVNFKVNTDQVKETGDLPRIAPHLYACRVAEHTDPERDLWFKFIVEGQENNLVPSTSLFGRSGYWQECVAPGTPIKIDTTVMPHIMDYDPDTQAFHFRKGEWADRKVGTETSNPDPSFIGRSINDVSAFQGRLVFLAGSNVVMSRTDRELDFWFGSLSAQAETDPIDVKSRVDASLLMAAIQYNKDLVVFSNKGQFVIPGRNLLTPENAALVLTSSFEAELRAKPVAAGRNVFFASNFGAYTGIREFFTEGGTEINDSRPVTQHVNKYIVGKATSLSTSSNYDILLVNTDNSFKDTYVYQYIWADKEKVQSAWHKWTMSQDIVFSFFDDELVYLVQKIGDDYYLLRMSLDVHAEAGVPYPVYLDQRFDVLDCYEAFVLPYDYYKDAELVLVQGEDCPNPGLLANVQSIEYDDDLSSYVVTLKKNMYGGRLLCGVRFKSRYIPTMPFVKDQDGVAVATGKLRLRSLLVSLSKTGEIIGRILSKWGNSGEVRFNGRIVGDINNTVGEQPLSDEVFTMPFRQNAQLAEVEFYTDSHLPMTMLDIEWVGQYSKRGRRISTGG